MARMPLFNLTFLGLGWPWVGEFVGFINNIYVFSNPTLLGRSQTPLYLPRSWGLGRDLET